MNFTDEANLLCEKLAVFWVDIHDPRRLAVEHVSTDEKLGECGCSKPECADLEAWINKYRQARGDDPLPANSITPKTTIKELAAHVC